MKIKKTNIPNAANGMTSLAAFGRRKRYILRAYPLIDEANGINFWYGEEALFGKIDKQAYPIVVKEEFIEPFDSAPQYRALNFVVDAFEAFLEHINKGFGNGVISAIDTFLLGITPKKAYEDPLTAYQNLLSSHLEFYSGPWVERLKGSVKTFEDFVNQFIEFSDVILQKSPITFSDYMISDRCSHRYTGLVVEIKDFDSGDDKTKWNQILKDRNFSFFQNAARKFGFKIDYNAPWRLIADVTTKEMKEYMAEYQIGSVEDLFEQYYERAHTKDIDFLSPAMISYYMALVSRNPLIKIPKTLSINTNVRSSWRNQYKEDFSKTGILRIRRKPLLEAEIPGDKFWLEFYFRVRIKEAGVRWHLHLVREKINHSKRLYDLFDFDRAMRYINNQIFENARG